MIGNESWQGIFDRWLEPFLTTLHHKAQGRWAPVYLQGLLGPGERKSVEPMASRVAPADVQQLHHFISTSPWDPAPGFQPAGMTYNGREVARRLSTEPREPAGVLARRSQFDPGLVRSHATIRLVWNQRLA